MILTDIGRSLLKRWPVTLIGMLLTAIAVISVVRETPVTYHLKSSLVLLPPQTAVGVDGNPYLQLGGLEQALDVLVRAVADDDVKDNVLKTAPQAEYIVQRDATTSGPILVIEVTAATQDATTEAMTILRATVPDELEKLQSDLAVSPQSRVTSREIAVDTAPRMDNTNQIRMLIAISGIGIVITLGAVAVTDRMLEGRRRRRHAVSNEPLPSGK